VQTSLLVLALLLGIAVGAGGMALLRDRHDADTATNDQREPSEPSGIAALLNALPQAAVLVSPSGAVIQASPEALTLGIVSGERLSSPVVTALVSEVARAGQVLDRDEVLRRPRVGRTTFDARIRIAPLPPTGILVLVDDLSDSRRVEAVRRDFVANVSHELKTPVGALGLLAEAVEAASDDPEQVQHFARRMRIESARLAALVADLIDLSRIQGDNPLEHAEMVSVDHIVAEAIDAIRMSASAKGIDIVRGGTDGLTVVGVESQLAGALRNLIANAIIYSPEGTRVAVGTRLADGIVEVSVTDQGVGIPVDEQARVFERFYRVDPARSRGTGGTGLGLAIVKHVCANHGGEVTLWSRPGEGSTFTVRLPAQEAAAVRLESAQVAS